MSEVGALIVRLQAETAQFREDMGKVKSDLNDLKDKTGSASSGLDSMNTSTRGVQNQIGLLDNVIRGRLPMALADLVRKFSDTSAVMALLPVAATVAGIAAVALIVGKLIQAHEELKQKLIESARVQEGFGNAAGEVLSGLQEKLLESGIKVDDLTKNHVAALKKELELINDQSLDDLVSTFNKFASEADKVFANLKTSWYEFGIGSAGAKNALEEFQTKYESLKLAGDKAGMTSLLSGTLRDAKDAQVALQNLQNLLPSNQTESPAQANAIRQSAQWQQQLNTLKKDGLVPFLATADAVRSELDSQNALVLALESQTKAAQTIAQIKTNDTTVAKLGEAKKAQTDTNKAMEEEAALQRVITAGVDAHIAAVHRLAQTNAEATLAGQKTPDQSSDDGLKEKLAAIALEHNVAVTAANDILTAQERAYNADSKLAAANAAKKRELYASLVNAIRANADTINQADAEANSKSVAATAEANAERINANRKAVQEMAEDTLKASIEAAKRQEEAAVTSAKNLEALGKQTSQQTATAEELAAKKSTEAEANAYKVRLAALDKFDKDYLAKVKQLQAEIVKTEQEGANQVNVITTSAAQHESMTVIAAQNKMADAVASDIAKSIVMNKSLAQAFRQTGEQMAEQMIKNLLVAELTGNKQKLSDAKTAASSAYAWATPWGGPIAGGIAAAAAFAGVMSFEIGGKIPGSGPVPITGHGGETVVTKALTDRVEASEGRNSGGGMGAMHMHFAPTIHAVDAKGVDDMLKKHGSIFQRHLNDNMRKMNK